MKLVAGAGPGALRFGRGRRLGGFGVGGIGVLLRGRRRRRGIWRRRLGRLTGRCRRRGAARRAVADRDAVVETQHDDDGARLFARQHVLGGLPPIEVLVAPVVADQAGGRPDLAHDADLRRIRERLFEPVAEPVGKRIADHQNRAGRRRLDLARRRRLGGINRLRRLRRLAERAVAVAEKPERKIIARRRLLLLALPELGVRGLSQQSGRYRHRHSDHERDRKPSPLRSRHSVTRTLRPYFQINWRPGSPADAETGAASAHNSGKCQVEGRFRPRAAGAPVGAVNRAFTIPR